MQSSHHPLDTATYRQVRAQLNDLLAQEEDFWKQRAKSHWLEGGDLNSKYFHAVASARKPHINIEKIRDMYGAWVSSQAEICIVAGDYFVDLFMAPQRTLDHWPLDFSRTVSKEDNMFLTSPFRADEFKDALFQMHPDKSLGPDGFNSAFFQHFGPVVGTYVVNHCVTWLRKRKFPPTLNQTNLVLIRKCSHPTSMQELTPIALCIVVNKIMAKVLANRLKGVLLGIISDMQFAFVPGRSICDNILVAFEVIHYIKRKTKGKKGNVALKIDISKLYDWISWTYLEQVMRKMGFENQFIQLIMLYVTTVK